MLITERKVWVEDGNYEYRMVCRKHPRYRLLRKPISGCKACLNLWKLVDSLDSEKPVALKAEAARLV